MNRKWITGLTLATVAGSGGAFAGLVVGNHDAPVAAQPQSLVTGAALLRIEQPAQAAQSRTISYQVGAAGTVTLTLANGSLTVNQTAVGAGWAVARSTALGTHVEVQYTDTLQLVTFGADLVNNDVVVSLTNVAAQGAVAAAPVDVSVITNPNPQPQPATPPPTASAAIVRLPNRAATTAPSGGGAVTHKAEQEASNDD
jgi:hypothetical protein